MRFLFRHYFKFLILFLGVSTGLLVIINKSPNVSFAQNVTYAQEPSFACMGGVNCVPSMSPTPVISSSYPSPTVYNGGQPSPTQAGAGMPSATPGCEPAGVSAVTDASAVTKHTRKRGGGGSEGLFKKIIELLKQLIELLKNILGSGGINTPAGTNPANPTPTGVQGQTGQQAPQEQKQAGTLPPCPTNTPAVNQPGGGQPTTAQPTTAQPTTAPGNAAPTAAGGTTPAPTGGGNVVQSEQCSGTEPPPGAKEAGLTKLAFCEDFSDPSRFDFDGNPVAGKTTFAMLRNGNIFSVTEESKDSFEFTQQGTMVGNSKYSNYQADFISSWPTGGGNYQGFAVSKNTTGWYTESKLKHNTASLNTGFFAFWSMATCKIYGSGPSCIEPDFYEYIGGKMIHAIHWYPQSGSNDGRKSAMCSVAPNSDRTQFFTTGVLYGPGNAYIRWYDNEQMTCEKTSGEYPQMADMANQDYPIIFGTGPGQPYEIDFVRVWVKP